MQTWPQQQEEVKYDAQQIETNTWHPGPFDFADKRPILPHKSFGKYIYSNYFTNPGSDWQAACPQFIAECAHKQPQPLFALKWIKDGKQLITGTSTGVIIQWNTQSKFHHSNSCTVHNNSKTVMAITVSNYERYIISGDKEGVIVYSNIKLKQKNQFEAHKNTCIRDLSFSNSSLKFVSCADDNMCKVWDFARSKEEFSFSDHRSDVKSCDWHPFESLVVTGSKDSYVKVWDPRTGGKGVHTIQAHNNTITQVRWNPINGNWFLTGSRDSKIKVYDIRKLDQEFNCFEGHDDPVNVVAWHPFKEDLFASATHAQKNGQIIYWHASSGVMLHKIDFAHDQMIWGMAWHPTGQMLATTSNDQKVRFWGIQKPYETVQPPMSMPM